MKAVQDLTQIRGEEDWQVEVEDFLEGWNPWISWKIKTNPEYFMGKEMGNNNFQSFLLLY